MRLDIADIAFGGKGVARENGRAVFVPFVAVGERVEARLVREKKRFAEAELVAVETPSPARVEAPCPYFGACGGCAYQHLDYAAQLALKQRQVEQTLRRIGKLDPVPMRPIIPSPAPYGYRNRIRVHVRDGVVGFHSWDDRRLIDIAQCLLAAPAVNAQLAALRQRRDVRDGDYTLAATETVYFEQTNPAVAALLREHVATLAARDHELLIDAYCGAGFFAKALRAQFPRVLGLEANPRAVTRARADAAPNETYLAGDVAALLAEALAPSTRTTVILDPPAAGVEPRVCDQLLAALPREIIYVSCHPGTLARDLAILCRTYALQSITPLDMFPQTAEIEVIAHLRARA